MNLGIFSWGKPECVFTECKGGEEHNRDGFGHVWDLSLFYHPLPWVSQHFYSLSLFLHVQNSAKWANREDTIKINLRHYSFFFCPTLHLLWPSSHLCSRYLNPTQEPCNDPTEALFQALLSPSQPWAAAPSHSALLVSSTILPVEKLHISRGAAHCYLKKIMQQSLPKTPVMKPKCCHSSFLLLHPWLFCKDMA